MIRRHIMDYDGRTPLQELKNDLIFTTLGRDWFLFI